MQPTHRSSRLLQPVRMGFVVFSLLLALTLSLIPAGHFLAMPDFVALVLAFWCVREPLRVGMATGFVLGLVVDVAHGAVMGQHAAAYVLLAWASLQNSRRLLWFSPGAQALHMLPLFLMVQVVMLLLRLLAGDRFPGWEYFFTCFTTAILWLPAHYLLLLPQLRPEERDENRPL
ncbi:MAG: rod shape-determining protein MreD [Candidatus Dactylopiibacterium carminicum]|uniref:Rod shape-determining protein MreD n=1 Tax=Candidatus Dactylopiibacterium carminicum TaxID=857335 RepID=A0A272EWQ5_9RHOO|nr:rod shape-determining protein MreD [Candidatus Dactylopiibacterium carminicum]KAF7600062.1 rod shape-determining protein MreD [Candidatus Dactylopiibacterium carminicum]PAS94548.1 MAG: rod shape-determining protein MreD [Candidatus Dactylopiibacterium carminicum]PAS97587.1 MAG: rod shape-determining protein MreD [Candidatus Dactylopiibacterium carminicum]PAT00064.1 MAG: rod shape-determining protein MreD [Candidatus Dactylopiibacterium carminicum]